MTDSVGPRELFKILCASKRFIIIASVVVSLTSFTVSLFLPRSYSATTVVAPVSNIAGKGPLSGGGSSAISGLAEMVGMSSILTESFIRDNNLLPILYDSNPNKLPTLWRANQFFRKRVLDVRVDKRTDLITVTVVWKDPNLAAAWANGLVRAANDYLRGKALTDAARNIAYLNEEAARTDVAEARQVIYSAMRVEMGKQMLAKGKEEYAFKVIDPALVVERPIPPGRLFWLPFGLLMGLFVSSFLVTLRAALA
jgi:uncharacterized protein involved in exopolysaccharide biosynthesis